MKFTVSDFVNARSNSLSRFTMPDTLSIAVT